ncbi:MAG: phage head-tail adapter protein [Defluviitaleaceae bacterium]|nr:phage head-tail adapter protein [Defluviitaleaceae bacterium]
MTTKQERSAIFKSFQSNIKKGVSFDEGKANLLTLRKMLSEICDYIFDVCSDEDFCKIPLKTDKTIAYYLYHLNRIEDVTSNILIAGKAQLFFSKNFNKLLNAPIITTGNEIARDELIEFSKALNIKKLRAYVFAVMTNTNEIIQDMGFKDSKTKISTERKAEIIRSKVVSTDESAFWLIDYWCNKTYAGLMLMPFSRHLMLHLDGCLRIINKIKSH